MQWRIVDFISCTSELPEVFTAAGSESGDADLEQPTVFIGIGSEARVRRAQRQRTKDLVFQGAVRQTRLSRSDQFDSWTIPVPVCRSLCDFRAANLHRHVCGRAKEKGSGAAPQPQTPGLRY